MFWNPETVSLGGGGPAEVDRAFGWEVSHTGHLLGLDETLRPRTPQVLP